MWTRDLEIVSETPLIAVSNAKTNPSSQEPSSIARTPGEIVQATRDPDLEPQTALRYMRRHEPRRGTRYSRGRRCRSGGGGGESSERGSKLYWKRMVRLRATNTYQ